MDRAGWRAQAAGASIPLDRISSLRGRLESAIEAPRKPGVRFESVMTISPGGGKGKIAHLLNDVGAPARSGAIRQTLAHYPEAR